jgi:hypothetical protein
MGNEAGFLEDTQVLGDGWPAHGELRCEFAHRAGATPQELEDLPSRRIAERVERVSVSLHLP